jgi:large subunit ribosomal protein L21
MDYAIIRVGGKQYRVREGERLLVDRVKTDEGKSFAPEVLLGDDGASVMATVVAHERGPKVRIGKYKRRTGYKRHTGFRAAVSRIEISLGGKPATARAAKPKAEQAPKPKAEPASQQEAAAEAPAHVKGMPSGYEGMTVAQVAEGAKTWNRPMLEAALEYEQANAQRKGALAALNSALAAKEEND